jgi:hypothetical protein
VSAGCRIRKVQRHIGIASANVELRIRMIQEVESREAELYILLLFDLEILE